MRLQRGGIFGRAISAAATTWNARLPRRHRRANHIVPEWEIKEDELNLALQGVADAALADSHGCALPNGGNMKRLVTRGRVNQLYMEREREDCRWYHRIGARLRAELSDDRVIHCITGIGKLGVRTR